MTKSPIQDEFMSTEAVAKLADYVMKHAVNSGAVTTNNIDRSVEIMRAEIKSFLFDDEYEISRPAVINGEAFQGVGLVILCRNIETKIRKIKVNRRHVVGLE